MIYEIYDKKTKEVKHSNKTEQEAEEILKNNKELDKRLLIREGYSNLTDIKIKTKVLNALNKLLVSHKEPVLFEDINKEKDLCVMDPANVAMVIAKTQQAKIILCNFIDKDDYKEEPERFHKQPPLTLEILEEEAKIALSKYSTEYLKHIINLFTALTDSISLALKHDHPLMAESSDFIVILAPRISED